MKARQMWRAFYMFTYMNKNAVLQPCSFFENSEEKHANIRL